MSTPECILCLDEKNDEPLVDNNRCTCRYYYHVHCWSKIEKNRCIMCNINYKKIFIISPLAAVQSLSESVDTQQQQQPIEGRQSDEIRIQINQQRPQQQRRHYLTEKNEYVCYILIVVCAIMIIGLLMSSSFMK
jgi:hypothetical protein